MTQPFDYTKTPGPYGAGGYAYPALDLNDPGTQVLLGHTGTLMTDGQGNGDIERTITRDGYDVLVGQDVSAAGINPYLKADADPLPFGVTEGPAYDKPIY